MHTASKLGVFTVAALLLGGTVLASTANAADKPVPSNKSVEIVQFAGGQGHGLALDKNAPEGTKETLESNTLAAAATANVCGAGYTISTGAWRYGTNGTTYTWTNGTSTGGSYYDKPICAVFFNDTGSTRYMGVRLNDNYTSTAATQDFGSYSTYAGPVYQKRGYCGTVYSYMKSSSGAVVIDNVQTVGSCN
ncbi:hypothetical protein V1460_10100 [Streptomyces sp. SCSIO 30461]|uniref:hypothetical protein n=1 Tax=Streptomyces sp. SCSIO 30461 TaxID=3118085 RepID=UPI0030D5B62E